MHPKQTEGSDVKVGVSLDQMYAQRFGQDTPIPSMQLCIENVDQAGGCAYGYACVYTDTISWAKEDEPLPMIRDPRAAFDQLFGVGATPSERAANRRTDRSILDWVTGEVARIAKGLGPDDKRRLDQYLTDIREIERRIQRVEAYNGSGEPRDLPGAPMGVPDSFTEHVKLMYDLQAIAFAADITRVFSFKLGRDGSARVYPESGAPLPFHPASHHGENEARVLQFAQINKYHVGLVPYFLEKLKNIQEGDANLLEKTLVVYGSPMGNSNTHNHKRCPLFLAGHANGMLKGNLHVKAADGTPMANAMLTLLHGLGLERHGVVRRQHRRARAEFDSHDRGLDFYRRDRSSGDEFTETIYLLISWFLLCQRYYASTKESRRSLLGSRAGAVGAAARGDGRQPRRGRRDERRPGRGARAPHAAATT